MFLFKMLGGSFSYGLNTPASDVDNRGVFHNTDMSDVFGMTSFEHFENTKDNADDKFKELRSFFKLLKGGNTEMVELLFSETFEYCGPIFEYLRQHRTKLVDTDKLFKVLCGYMQGERKLMNGERRGKKGGHRYESIEKYGYSPKNAVQMLRLAWAGQTLFEKGYFPVNVATENPAFAQELLAIKTEPEKFKVEDLNLRATLAENRMMHAFAHRGETYRFNTDLMNDVILSVYTPHVALAYQDMVGRLSGGVELPKQRNEAPTTVQP